MPSCLESAQPMFSSEVKPNATRVSPIRWPVSRWRASAVSTWVSLMIPVSTRIEVRVRVGLLGLVTERTSHRVDRTDRYRAVNRKACATDARREATGLKRRDGEEFEGSSDECFET